MRLKKTTGVAIGLMATLSLAACGGSNNASPAAAPPAAASVPVPASAPVAASTAAVSTVVQTQAYTTYQYLDTTVVGKAATLTFQPNAFTGELAIGTTNYATLATDIANDAMMTVGGTPIDGITLGELQTGTQQVLTPSVIETCESVAGDGTPNPAVANAPTKSTNVFMGGIFVVDGTALAGHTFGAYYEDCMRDGNPVTPATQSSLIIDGSGNETIFDSRTGLSNTIPVTSTLAQASAAGLHGDWIVPYLYVTSTGQLRYALVEHGLIAQGNTRNFVGIWLEQ
jgi:hypothetical protein